MVQDGAAEQTTGCCQAPQRCAVPNMCTAQSPFTASPAANSGQPRRLPWPAGYGDGGSIYRPLGHVALACARTLVRRREPSPPAPPAWRCLATSMIRSSTEPCSNAGMGSGVAWAGTEPGRQWIRGQYNWLSDPWQQEGGLHPRAMHLRQYGSSPCRWIPWRLKSATQKQLPLKNKHNNTFHLALAHLDVEALDLHRPLLPHPPGAPDGLVLKKQESRKEKGWPS